MENTSKQSEVSDTRSKSSKLKGDGIFIVRLRLTLYYTLFTAIIIGGFSVILHQTLLDNFAETLKDTAIGLNPVIFKAVVDRAQVMLANRLLIADIIILCSATILGFLLTQRTLKPLRDSMYRQKRFIADASHELRTPIAVVISGLEVALRNRNLTLEDSKASLSDALEEMKGFSALTNNLLDLSKRDLSNSNDVQDRSQYRQIDIAELVHMTASKMKKLADEKSINFQISIKRDIHVTVQGNETELARVFYNIIHNAISYTPVQGTIIVEGHISLGKYVVTVTDSGMGIPSNMLDKIFEPFFQGDASRTNEKGGAGLGLPIAKQITESHDGSIVIKSKEHYGTKAVVSLPLSS
jgi:two-component system sensor histidine kinase CiaH